ncbi:MAG: ATP-binding protein [Chlorobium sp.]
MHGKAYLKFGLIIGIIIFFSSIVSFIFLGNQLSDLLTAEIRKELHREILFHKHFLEQKSGQLKTTDEAVLWAGNTGNALDVRVTLIDLDGHVIADSYVSSNKIPLLENHRGRPEISAALVTGYGENTRYSQTVKEQMLYVAVPVGQPKPSYVLRFAKPLYDIRVFQTGIHKDIERDLLLALVFSLATGFLTSFFITRPLRTLADTAQRRIHGDLSGKLPDDRKDEIGVIARAFNVLSNDIQKMQLSEEWYQAVFSGIREAIIVTESAGNIILVNPAASRMFRIDGGMFMSRPLKHLADSNLQELFAKVHHGRLTLNKEEMSLMSVKGSRIMQISSMPVMKYGKFDGTVFVLNDITKLRNLERIRRDFVSSVSHELRTPLTIISGYTETLLEGAMHDTEHATEFLQIILQASEQLTALVNDVLELSRIESGHIEYQLMAVDIKSVIAKSVNLLKLSLDKKNIKLDINIPDDIPLVYADSVYLEIVVRNLLDNAIKYVNEHNGKIRITVFRHDNDVRIDVEDNGIGISKDNLSRIFERFYRVDKARSRQLGGTGLGLSIVKHIVLAHKGNVEVHSRINQGSVFSVSLPVAPKDAKISA